MAEITIKSVEGNPLNINVVMTAVEHSMLNGEIVTETVDFYPDTSKPVRAYLDCTTTRKQYCPTTYVDGNIVYLSCDNATAGVYTLTVTCTDTNGKARRYKSDACIEVYDLTSAAEIAGTFDEQTYEMNGVFYTFGGGGVTVQSDWDESNPESPAYIRNKPNLSDYVTDEELQAVEEQIPDIPEWAMQPQKPTYTPQEVGAQPLIADLDAIRAGAEKGATAYQKPSGGIPKSDLSSSVQTSLGKADTALQSYTETDPIFTASPAHGITSSDITNWDSKQPTLTFDSTPTAGSNNPVTSAGIKTYVDNATPTITMDDTPTSGSSNPVKSSGVKTALDLKANQSTTYTKTEVDALFDDVAYLGDDDGQATTLDFDPQADTVWNKAQTLGSAQQAQARNNIGAVGSVTVNGTTYTPTNGNVDLGTISGGGGSVTVDSQLSTSSTNPVQNGVITTALNGKVGSSTITSIVSLTEAAYTALATKDASTLYVIVES